MTRIFGATALMLTMFAGAGFAEPGVLVEVDADTVTKFIYLGVDPNNAAHPAVTVEGKLVGLDVKANSASGAKAVVGKVVGYDLSHVGAVKVGVAGAGESGVFGQGVIGVQGKGSDFGLSGVGDLRGVSGIGNVSGATGVRGWSSGTGSKGVYGEAATGLQGLSTHSSGAGVHGMSNQYPGIGVRGESMQYGPGVQGTGVNYGVYGALAAEPSYWATAVMGHAGFNGASYGVYGLGAVGVYGTGEYYGVEGNGGSGYAGVLGTGGTFTGYFTGDVYAEGVVYDGSDLALKENVRDMNYGLNTVLALRPKAYEMKQGEGRGSMPGTRLGLIAQDLERTIPEVVRTVKRPPPRDAAGHRDFKTVGETTKAVNYASLIPVLIKAIQEQQAQIAALEARVR